MQAVIKDHEFHLVEATQTPDSQNRLSLTSATGQLSSVYNIYRNRLGQIVLDPVQTIPPEEAWLWENPEALASLERGLADAAAGRVVDGGDFSAYLEED